MVTFNSLNKSEFISNVIFKLILISTLIMTVVSVFYNIRFLITKKSLVVILYLVVVTIFIYILVYLINLYIQEKFYIYIVILVSAALRFLFVIAVKTPITSDFLIMYNAAKNVVAGDISWLEQCFFTTWGYLIPYVYYEALILKLFGSSVSLLMLNIIFMVGTNLLIYLIAKEFTTPKAAFISAFLYSIYPAPILMSSVLTNQHISLFFLLLGIYYYLVNPTWKRIILSAVFLFLGNLMRPEGIVIFCAIVLHNFIQLKDAVKCKCVGAIIKKVLILFLVYISLYQTVNLMFKATGAAPNGIFNNCPEWKFVLGMDSNSKGFYSEENSYIISISDSSQRKKEVYNIISSSLKSCSIPSFFLSKIELLWGGFETISWSLSHIETSRLIGKPQSNFTYEEAINVILAVEKSIYILVFIALIFTILILWREKEKNDINFFVALIFTNYIVYLFIEIQVRYRYFIMPSFFILLSVVLKSTIEKMKGKVSESA